MLRKLFRIQYATAPAFLKPCAPYLVLIEPPHTTLKLNQWKRVICLSQPRKPLLCEEENVAIVCIHAEQDLEDIEEWSYLGAQICAISRTPFYHPAVRLWIHASPTCSHHIVGKTLYVGNPVGEEVWMEFPTMDAQELEAASKRACTPLRLERGEADIASV